MKNKIESFLYEKLKDKEYIYESKASKSLLTWSRLDLAFKLFYLENKDKNNDFAKYIYKYDIKSQTHDKFKEYGNDEKNSFEQYILEFENIFKSIQKNGFDKNKTIIPLSTNGTIRNKKWSTQGGFFYIP